MSGMKIMEYHQNKKDYNFISSSSSDNKVNEKNSTNNLEKWSAVGLFQTPLYIAEGYEINQNIVEETTSIIEKPGRVRKNEGNNFSDNVDIFNSLNFEEYPEYEKIKKYCQSHLNNYVKEILCPVQEDVEFYFTQSWVNITRPGEFHHRHAHQNSIISGIFYLNTVKNDNVNFYHPMGSLFHQNQFEPTQWNIFNSSRYAFSPRNGDLLLFPSWLDHSVEKNDKQTKYDRISLSFNTFARGSFGRTRDLNGLHLS